jgi:hypothetical protein
MNHSIAIKVTLSTVTPIVLDSSLEAGDALRSKDYPPTLVRGRSANGRALLTGFLPGSLLRTGLGNGTARELDQLACRVSNFLPRLNVLPQRLELEHQPKDMSATRPGDRGREHGPQTLRDAEPVYVLPERLDLFGELLVECEDESHLELLIKALNQFSLHPYVGLNKDEGYGEVEGLFHCFGPCGTLLKSIKTGHSQPAQVL